MSRVTAALPRVARSGGVAPSPRRQLDGLHFMEHVILDLADGKIARQVEVEAWE